MRANPNVVLAEKILPPDIIGHRNQRLELIQKLQQMPMAPNCKAISDCIQDNMKSAATDLSHPVNVLIAIANECRRGMQEMQQARSLISARCSRLPAKQLSDDACQQHLSDFSSRCSKDASCYQQCLSTIDSFLLQQQLPASMTSAALPANVPLCALQLQHAASVIRAMVHRISSTFAADVFTSRFAWAAIGDDPNVKSDLARMRATATAMTNFSRGV